MTLQNWGEMQKSVTDSETIEDAINRLVQAHDDDPTSHLDSGQSLEAHKTDTVLDHPQSSILPDKWTNSQLDFDTTFENLDVFVLSGTPTENWPGWSVDPSTSGFANREGVFVDGESSNLPFNTTNDMLFQISFSVESGSDDHVLFKMGPYAFGDPGALSGMGCYIDHLDLTCYIGDDDGSDTDTLTAETLTGAQTYIFRAFANSNTGKVEYYLDGALLGSLEWPTGDYTDYTNVAMWGWNDSGNGPVLKVKSLYFSTTP